MNGQDDVHRIVAFWRNAGPAAWFAKDLAFDQRFRDEFLDLHMACARREHDDWLNTAEGALALMLLLDQFPRNAFRGTAHMFATDPLARYYAEKALQAGHDHQIDSDLRAFMYLPLEHSEAPADQARSVALFEPLGATWLPYAITHRDIIERFGRFPHRNAVLGRHTTPQEQAFLDSGGFAG